MMARNRSASARSILSGTLLLCGLLIAAQVANAGVNSSSCPRDAIAIVPGASIQATVDRAGDGAAFCLKNGVHRAQAVRPRSKQRFYGEGHTALNGNRLLADFRLERGYWGVSSQIW